MVDSLISASMMCADQLNLAADIVELENADADMLHLDIMDGNYVRNIALGIGACNAITKATRLPVDIHLLVLNPELYLEQLSFGEGDIVSAHLECIGDPRTLAETIHGRGASFGIVLNRGIEVQQVEPYLPFVDVVSLMMIEPGFAGLKLLDGSIEKIGRMREYLSNRGKSELPIEVDGNVSFEHAPKMRDAGANIFVAGSSSVFSGSGIIKGMKRLRSLV